MSDLKLVIVAGLFSLGGVLIGALLTPFTQLYLERMRDHRAANRAKLLVAQELLHAELILRSASEGPNWPPIEDADAYLPTSAWRENRSFLVRDVDEDLLNHLTMAYAVLEFDKQRFIHVARHLPSGTPLQPKEAKGLKEAANKLARLRRQLGGGGGWLEELQDQFKPQLESLNSEFKQLLDGLSDEDIKKDAVITEIKRRAHALGELNRNLGDDGAWSAEINAEIERRSVAASPSEPPSARRK